MDHAARGTKAICLLSGGLDSTVAVYCARAHGYDLYALTVDYGQLHAVEIDKACLTVRALNIPHEIIKLSLPWKGSALLDSSITIPEHHDTPEPGVIPVTYVPGRNTIFISLAFSWAETVGATAVFIGANQIDYSGYPDCRGEYLYALEEALRRGTKCGVEGRSIVIQRPLLQMSKKDIVLLGAQLKVPFENTWSCYKGGETPCAVCDACRLRARGFRDAGIPDVL